MRILLVEDDRAVADAVRRGLSEEGFIVDHVADGEEAREALRTGGYDAAILDVNLPGVSGFDIARDLRLAEGAVATPVLFLTARDAVADRVRGFELGGTDYLVKPFAFAELLARVRALIRRPPAVPALLRYEDLELDPARREVRHAGQPIVLPPREFRLLEALLRHPGIVMARERLELAAWPDAEDLESNALEAAVYHLRRRLAEPAGHHHIETIRGVGYVLR
ncbi:response regulator transcription factor [Tepidiforma flava]|uniref:Response regulator transcription factor n=1 Tax=Tepidiforma flava TaxID=3004094 RepID=A0ABY7MA73_9CHLR|nr:response regulator transcription factor [Tepidiforma flava]WBL37400.1 response regulator transcription factor [Tepidiforma flava]